MDKHTIFCLFMRFTTGKAGLTNQQKNSRIDLNQLKML